MTLFASTQGSKVAEGAVVQTGRLALLIAPTSPLSDLKAEKTDATQTHTVT